MPIKQEDCRRPGNCINATLGRKFHLHDEMSYALVSSSQFKRPLEATKKLKPAMSSQTLSNIDPSCFGGLEGGWGEEELL